MLIAKQKKGTEMHQDCGVCNNIAGIHTDTYPCFVAELETGYVTLGHFRFFNWKRLLASIF